MARNDPFYKMLDGAIKGAVVIKDARMVGRGNHVSANLSVPLAARKMQSLI